MDSLATVVGMYRRGLVHEAENACREALRRDADDAGFLGLLSEIMLSTGRTEAALPALTRLALLRPGDAANHRRLAVSASRSDEVRAALGRVTPAAFAGSGAIAGLSELLRSGWLRE